MSQVRQFAGNLLRNIANKVTPAIQGEYNVIVTDQRANDGGSKEVVKASSEKQAAELAANAVAMRRLKATPERSWRYSCAVNGQKYNVVVQAILRSEAQ